MSLWDVNRLAASLLCVAAAVAGSVLASRALVPDTAPARPAIAIAGADPSAVDPSAADPSTGAPAPAPIARRLAHASADRGAVLAAANCGGCHTLERGGASMVGPNLFGVADRPVAAEAGFGYSDALRQLGGRWTADRLDRWLLRPQAMAPGTLMGFAGLPDPDQRADLIAFLQKQAPVPATPAVAPAAPPAATPTASSAVAPAAPPAAAATTTATTTTATPAAFEVLVDRADVRHGADIAAGRCGGCHGFDQGGVAQVGPNLFGVFGRPIAQGADFSYSAALSAHGGRWTATVLGDWLLDPGRFAPGTRMGFAGIADPADRAAVVAYLRTLHP